MGGVDEATRENGSGFRNARYLTHGLICPLEFRLTTLHIVYLIYFNLNGNQANFEGGGGVGVGVVVKDGFNGSSKSFRNNLVVTSLVE